VSNNKIKTLNVSANFALEDLSARSNSLKKIDLSQQSALRFLDLANNRLKTVDASFSNALTTVNLARNPLTKLTLVAGQPVNWIDVRSTSIKTLDIRALDVSLVQANGTIRIRTLDPVASRLDWETYLGKDVKVTK
jgi:Leucine-rich repeat (LRR) protein